ncbi:MAG: hypothetical protein ACOX52_20180 [Verrucomicrobiota bacterium]|jgi:hypothetical protein
MNFDMNEFNDKDVVFVGVGRGRALEGIQPFVEQHGQIASFTGVDKQPGDDPLGFLKDYDPGKTIFIKNEGIPGHELSVPYITPLQIFFRLAKENNLRVPFSWVLINAKAGPLRF